MNLTTKQVQLMTVICSGSRVEGEEWNDLDQILDRLDTEHHWRTTKASIQFSIRTLIEKHGMIEKAGREKRRGRNRVILKPTTLGLQSFGDPRGKLDEMEAIPLPELTSAE